MIQIIIIIGIIVLTSNIMLVFIVGKLGSGKTLLSSIFAYYSKKEIYSNFTLQNMNKPIHKFNLNLLFSEELQNASIFIDEAYTILESRRSLSNDNIIMSNMYFQSRKRDIDFYLGVQLAKSIDVRFRDLADLVIACKKSENKNRFEYTISDFSSYKRLFIDFKNAEKFFDKFNTKELVLTKKMLKLKYREIDSEDTIDLISENMEKFKKFKFEYIGNDKIKKELVTLFCEMNDLPNRKDFINAFYYTYLKEERKIKNGKK